jgi:hypothetical protein
MEFYNENQNFYNIYVNGNVNVSEGLTTNIPLSCLLEPQNKNLNGFVTKQNGQYTVGSIQAVLNGVQANHNITNIGNTPLLCVNAILKNPTPISSSYKHTITDNLIDSNDIYVQCCAFNEYNEPVEIKGYIDDFKINLLTTTALDLTATIVLFKK